MYHYFAPKLFRWVLLLLTALDSLVIRRVASIPRGARSPNGLPYENTRAAVCLGGHGRSMMEPPVVAAYLTAFAHVPNLQTFAVISIQSADPTVPQRTDEAHSNASAFVSHYKDMLELYNVSEASGTLLFSDDSNDFVTEMFKNGSACATNGSCARGGHRCPLREEAYKDAHRRDTGWNEVEQMWKAAQCWGLISAWQERHAIQFSWIVRWRPDSIFLTRFPAFGSLGPPPFVNGATHDHYFICAGVSCIPFYVQATARYLDCSPGPDVNFWTMRHGYDHLAFLGYRRDRHSLSFLDKQLGYELYRKTALMECHKHHPGLCKIKQAAEACAQEDAASANTSGVIATATDAITTAAATAAVSKTTTAMDSDMSLLTGLLNRRRQRQLLLPTSKCRTMEFWTEFFRKQFSGAH